jgi:hypothetical protein
MATSVRPMIDGGSGSYKPAPAPAPKPAVTTPPPARTGTAAASWSGASSMGAPAQTSGPRPPAPNPRFPPEVNQARVEVFQQAYRQYMTANFQLYRRLPAEDQAEIRNEAQKQGEAAVKRFDQMFNELRTQFHRLPEEDATAAALSIAQSRMQANGGVAGDPAASYVSQKDGFPGGTNNNCGFAAGLAVLKFLGVQAPAGASTYEQVMALRELGLPGTTAARGSTVYEVADTMNLAGAHATAVPLSRWDAAEGVEAMKQKFLDPRNGSEAFIAGGQPAADGAWPEYSDFNGSHWVAVTDYDPQTNTFTVMDPYPETGNGHPIQVTPEQLEAYMAAAHDNQGYVEVHP